jgi:hypothetical protein
MPPASFNNASNSWQIIEPASLSRESRTQLFGAVGKKRVGSPALGSSKALVRKKRIVLF